MNAALIDHTLADFFTKSLKICRAGFPSILEKIAVHRRYYRAAPGKPTTPSLVDQLPRARRVTIGPTGITEGASTSTRTHGLRRFAGLFDFYDAIAYRGGVAGHRGKRAADNDATRRQS